MRYPFGADYYPGHWPKERRATDARLMRKMGIFIVCMAEFSWAKWEPRDGEFHFEDLDEVIDILAREDIDCVLGTPSAAPPAWIIEQNPEIQPIDTILTLLNNPRLADDKNLQAWAGHKDAAFTRRQYMTPREEQLRLVGNGFSGYISSFS